MIYSMTGFGRAEDIVAGRQIIVEIKSLNGKQFEIITKITPLLRPYELDIRSLLNNYLQRGTIDLAIVIKQDGISKPMAVNTALARYYYEAMKQIADDLSITAEQILPTIMRMPEVVTAEQDVLSEEVWHKVKQVIEQAARQLMEHRRHEGESLFVDLHSRVDKIELLLEEILPLEPLRAERIRSKFSVALKDFGEKLDANRFEQELIYYIERIDFSEEKTRLKQHCSYFKEVLKNVEVAKGKMLGFILQEIGREINTLGSKANDADIQQIVVQMKDELEKAKEQVLNSL